MKKIITLTALIIIIAACKKDRTCECTETRTGTSSTTGAVKVIIIPGFEQNLVDTTFTNPLNETRTYERKYVKTTKQKAKQNCLSYSEPFLEKTITAVPSTSFNFNVIVTNSGTANYDCKLK